MYLPANQMSPNDWIQQLVDSGALPQVAQQTMANPNFQGGIFQRTGGPQGPGEVQAIIGGPPPDPYAGLSKEDAAWAREYEKGKTNPYGRSLATAAAQRKVAGGGIDMGPMNLTMYDVFGGSWQDTKRGYEILRSLGINNQSLNNVRLSDLGDVGKVLEKRYRDYKKDEVGQYNAAATRDQQMAIKKAEMVAKYGPAAEGLFGGGGSGQTPPSVPGDIPGGGTRPGGPLQTAEDIFREKKRQDELNEKAKKERKAGDMAIAQGRQMEDTLNKALAILDGGNYGNENWGRVGQLSELIYPGGETGRVERLYQEVRGAIGRDTLAAMKAASPTGGALGSISEKELAMLESALGVLSQLGDPQEQKQQINKIKHHFRRVQALIYMGRQEQGEKLRAAEREFVRKFLVEDAAKHGQHDPDGLTLQDRINNENKMVDSAPALKALTDPTKPLPGNLQNQYEEYVRKRTQELRR